MTSVTKEQFLATLKSGDVGIIHARNFFATLQSWYRKKFKEGSEEASHGFLMMAPPRIAEANGIFVNDNATVIKNVGDKTKCWIFRYKTLFPDQLVRIDAFVNGAVQAGGHYSVGGIAQFAAQFFGIKKKVVDEGGVFCTEFTTDAIVSAGIPFINDRPPFQVTPSYQLNWLLTDGKRFGWFLAAQYDGDGHYFIADQLSKPEWSEQTTVTGG